MNRRSLLTGLASLIVAPAIVRVDSLMQLRGDIYRLWEWRCPLLPVVVPLNSWRPDAGLTMEQVWKPYLGPNGGLCEGIWTFFGKDHNIYSDKEVGFRKEEYRTR